MPQDIVAQDASMFREEAALWSVNQGGYNIPDMNLGGGRDAPMPIFGEEHNPYGLNGRVAGHVTQGFDVLPQLEPANSFHLPQHRPSQSKGKQRASLEPDGTQLNLPHEINETDSRLEKSPAPARHSISPPRYIKLVYKGSTVCKAPSNAM